MAKIIENLLIMQNLCTAKIYVELKGKQFLLCTKTTKNFNENINIEFNDDFTKFLFSTGTDGYTVYKLIDIIKNKIQRGQPNEFYSLIPELDKLEERIVL